jgi:hypothetical protein
MPVFAAASGPPFSVFPSSSIVPLRETVPEIARSVVVFPAPFAPRIAFADGERDVVQRLHRPVAGADPIELEERH